MKTEKLEAGRFDPPGHLSARSQGIWRAVVPRRCRSTERLTLLVAALEELDRCEVARQQVTAEGLIVKTLTTQTPHVHPALKVEQESRKTFAKLWALLGLESSRLDEPHCRDWESAAGIGLQAPPDVKGTSEPIKPNGVPPMPLGR